MNLVLLFASGLAVAFVCSFLIDLFTGGLDDVEDMDVRDQQEDE